MNSTGRKTMKKPKLLQFYQYSTTTPSLAVLPSYGKLPGQDIELVISGCLFVASWRLPPPWHCNESDHWQALVLLTTQPEFDRKVTCRSESWYFAQSLTMSCHGCRCRKLARAVVDSSPHLPTAQTPMQDPEE